MYWNVQKTQQQKEKKTQSWVTFFLTFAKTNINLLGVPPIIIHFSSFLITSQTKKYFHKASLCNWIEFEFFNPIVVLCCTCHFWKRGIDDNKSSSTPAGKSFCISSGIHFVTPFLFSLIVLSVFFLFSFAGSLYCLFSEVYFCFCIWFWKGKRFWGPSPGHQKESNRMFLSLFPIPIFFFFK